MSVESGDIIEVEEGKIAEDEVDIIVVEAWDEVVEDEIA